MIVAFEKIDWQYSADLRYPEKKFEFSNAFFSIWVMIEVVLYRVPDPKGVLPKGGSSPKAKS